MSLGIDFDNLKHLSPERFASIFTTLSTNKIKNKWALIDAFQHAKDNPEYDDMLTQVIDESQVVRASYEKYLPTARAFPIRRRQWSFSPELYYTVASLRDEDGNPLEHIQDELLRQTHKRIQDGETGVRKWLQAEVKKLKREPVTETETITASVGSIDHMLKTFHQLPDGYEVTIKYTKIVEYESSELENDIAELEAVA